MPSRDKLSESDITALLAERPEWSRDGDTIRRELQFGDFSEAFGFMTRVAMVAEKLNHHPDWSNVWNRVTVALSTHDAGGLTELDFELARRIDAIAGD